jgi:hypothetical protein
MNRCLIYQTYTVIDCSAGNLFIFLSSDARHGVLVYLLVMHSISSC